MKRTPPPGNVRRVPPGGYRFTFIGKDGSICQAKNFKSRVLAYLLERDPRVVRYVSQPLIIPYEGERHKTRHHIPDFQVFFADGTIGIYDAPPSKKLGSEAKARRDTAVQAYCQTNGYLYFVGNKSSLPNPTEVENLKSFYGFSARCFCDHRVKNLLLRDLEYEQQYWVKEIVSQISAYLRILPGFVVATICHMIWHMELNTNIADALFFIEGEPSEDSRIWRTRGGPNENI